ncbi:hypothetical protein [Bacillus licheniformis]|uniref:hypothetical protein n=1 Tax=Bacillus licheniformis TaxID=1402 RepID=UPI002E235226|nr:hypothetical protein [Bacillus licheniformis]
MDYNKTIGELVEDGYKVTIRTPAQEKAWKEQQRKREYRSKQGDFVIMKDKRIKAVAEQLTLSQAGLLFALVPFMAKGKQGKLTIKGQRLGKKEIAKIVNSKEDTVYRLLSELEAYGVLTSEKEGKRLVYSVNQAFITNTKLDEQIDYFTRVFKGKAEKLLKVLTVQELGCLMKMLQLANSRYLVLCHNPYELEAPKVQPLKREELAQELGVSLAYLKKLTKKLMEQEVLYKVTGKRAIYLLSPYLFSRLDREITAKELIDIINNKHEF